MGFRAVAKAAALASVAVTAACSYGTPGISPRVNAASGRATRQWDQISIYAVGKTTPAKVITDGVNGPDAMTMDSSGNLYVANIYADTVTVYSAGSNVPSRTIRTGIGQPVCLAVDSKGNLFVANAAGARGYTTEYAPGGTSVTRRIDATVDVVGWHDGQRGLAVDAAGNLYAATTPRKGIATVGVYRPNATTPARVIADGVTSPSDLAFDRSGNLYVMNGYGYSTGVYAPGAIRPFAQIDGGANDAAFDSRGRMYLSHYDAVVEYAPDHKTILRTIGGVGGVNAIAIDRYDNLYVGNGGSLFRGSVTVYSHRDGSLIRTIEYGVTQPSQLLFDKSGKLYVASYSHYE